MQVVNLEAMVSVLASSAVIAFLLERLKSLAAAQWEALSGSVKKWAWLPGLLIGGGLMWATGLNALPLFDTALPGTGRVLTCIAGALGPSAVYDLWDRLIKTKPPE